MKISGKVAIVTGGASGVGKAVSLRLLENGAKLVAIIDLDERSGQTTASEFSDKFGADRVKFFKCDVTQEDQLKNSFQQAYKVYGALDIVANNAGIASNDNRKTVEINLMAVINGTFIAEKLMTQEKRSERGVIINTASMAGLRIAPYMVSSSYVASKFGVVGFTKSLGKCTDGFSEDLRAVGICPSLIQTELWTRNNFQTKEHEDRVKVMKDENNIISVDMVVDAFIKAIEDDSLHGVLIKITMPNGMEVID